MKKGNGTKIKTSLSNRIAMCVAFAFIALYCLYILFFFLFAALLAIKPSSASFIADMMNVKLFSWPKGATLKNIYRAFTDFQIGAHTYGEMLFNSVWRSVAGTFIAWMTTVMVTYILVFYRSKYTKFIYTLGFFLTTLPLYGAGPATYRLMIRIGFINTPLMLLTNITLYGGHFFYMYSFWKGIAWEYAEAASIDGAGHYTVFFKIMLPMAVPSMMALYIMSFIANWNEYENTLLYMTRFPNLSYALYAYENSIKYDSGAGKPAYFAGLLIAMLPCLALFLIFQNTIMEKVYIGGLKG